MKSGYRFSKARALANYYADVKNTANFGLMDRLRGIGSAGADRVMSGGRMVDDRVKGLGRGMAGAVRPDLSNVVGEVPPPRLRRRLREGLASGLEAGDGRAGGLAALGGGAAALGGAGLAARNAFASDEDEMLD